MGDTWAIISLLSMIVVVFVANKKNINVGLVGIAMAMFIGTIAGLKYKQIIGGFNTTLFIRAMGMQAMIVVKEDRKGRLWTCDQGIACLPFPCTACL